MSPFSRPHPTIKTKPKCWDSLSFFRFHHLNLLPFGVQEGLLSLRHADDGRYRDLEEVIRLVATDEMNCEKLVRKSIAAIVKQSSLEQTFKSAVAAGVRKSLVYAMSKVKKNFKSRIK